LQYTPQKKVESFVDLIVCPEQHQLTLVSENIIYYIELEGIAWDLYWCFSPGLLRFGGTFQTAFVSERGVIFTHVGNINTRKRINMSALEEGQKVES